MNKLNPNSNNRIKNIAQGSNHHSPGEKFNRLIMNMKDNAYWDLLKGLLFLIAASLIACLPDGLQVSGYNLTRPIPTIAPAPLVAQPTEIPTGVPIGTPLPTTIGTLTPAPSLQSDCQYLIYEGDTLSEIAQYFHVPLETLVAENGLSNPDLIIAGSKLVIPDSETVCPKGPISSQ